MGFWNLTQRRKGAKKGRWVWFSMVVYLLIGLFLMGSVVACSQREGEPTREPTVEAVVEETEVVVVEPTAEPTVTAEPTPSPEMVETAEPELFEARIQLFIYRPEEITVPVGTTVRWLNEDAIQHSVTSGTAEDPTGVFDTGFFVQDETAELTFDEPGTYQFFCMRHTHMQGTIVVSE